MMLQIAIYYDRIGMCISFILKINIYWLLTYFQLMSFTICTLKYTTLKNFFSSQMVEWMFRSFCVGVTTAHTSREAVRALRSDAGDVRNAFRPSAVAVTVTFSRELCGLEV